MSHTNSTTNYNLPQFLTTDKPAWLTDINNAFSDIDAAVYAAKSTADTAFTDAGNAQTDATTAINNAAAADAKGSGALASIETTFDATSTYPVGSRVIYNSLLYRCIVAITTPGPWTGSVNWERITVDNLISATDSKIGKLSSLSTTDKNTLVGAVNEVNGMANSLSPYGGLHNTVATAIDLNDLKTNDTANKTYHINMAYCANAPQTSGTCLLEVFKPVENGAMILQRATNYGSLGETHIRFYLNSTWTNWEKISR